MQLQTILNRVEHFKSFVYGKARWLEDAERPTLEIEIAARKNGRPICSGCGQQRPGYDLLPERRFEYVPMWGIAVYFAYAMRRVECPACGVKVEQVPWCDGKNQLTTTYRWFLAGWAKRVSWKGTAEAFHTTWQNVFRSVEHAVSWGLAHRILEGVESIGVDEIQYQRGHKYLTLVYQTDENCRRLLWAGKERTKKTLLQFFEMFGEERSGRLRFVCSDMWKQYLTVIAEKTPQAIHVLDRYHIMAKMNKAIDKVRAGEARQMKDGRLRGSAEAFSLVSVEAEREPHGKASGEVVGTASVQLTVGPESPDARGLPAIPGVHLPGVREQVFGRVVYTDDAFED